MTRAGLINSCRLSNQSLRIMARAVVEHGLELKPLLREAGLQPEVLEDPWGTLDSTQELAFLRAYCDATRHIPAIGFLTGLRYSLISYGPLGLSVLTSRDVTEGLRVYTNLQALGFGLLEFQMLETDGVATGIVADDGHVPTAMKEFLHERFLGSGPIFMRDMLQRPMKLALIESPLDRPDGWMDLNERWQTDIVFRASRSCLHFADGAGTEPLPLANPLLADNYRKLCETLLEASHDLSGIAKSVHDLLLRSRPPFPIAREVAMGFGLSERSLYRKLKAEKSSFGQILDAVRLRRARELLENTQLPIAEISDRLGFSEVSSFSRSFRRLSGMSAVNYRRNNTSIARGLHLGHKAPHT